MSKFSIIEDLELSLMDTFDIDQIKFISTQLLCILKDYDITKKSTELVVYDTSNVDLLSKYAACMLLEGKSRNTVKQYIREARLLAEFYGNQHLEELTTTDIRTYLADYLRRGASKCSVNNYKNYISALYSWLHKEHIIVDNPCTDISAIKFNRKVKIPFSDIDIDKLRSKDVSLRNRAMMEVLLSSGVRVQELCNLNVEDIDLQSYRVCVHGGKGDKDRVTYISRIAAFHLSRYLNDRPNKTSALFVTYPNRDVKYQTRLDPDDVRDIFRVWGKSCGVANVHPHRFRHTFATTAYNKGMDLHQIQLLLGHDSIDTTLRYINGDNNGLAIAHHKISIQ